MLDLTPSYSEIVRRQSGARLFPKLELSFTTKERLISLKGFAEEQLEAVELYLRAGASLEWRRRRDLKKAGRIYNTALRAVLLFSPRIERFRKASKKRYECPTFFSVFPYKQPV
jgi:hypothetical protein